MLGLIFIMQGFHVLTLLAQPGPRTPARSSSWQAFFASRRRCMSPRHTLLKRHNLSVSACLSSQTSLRSANMTSSLTGSRPWRHHHPRPSVLCVAHLNLLRWALGALQSSFAHLLVDVRWPEACCAGTRPCHP